MNNETFITVSLAEYKELLELKIRSEYELKIKDLEAESKDNSEQANYWFERFCKLEKALNEANSENTALKDRLSFYEPVKKEGEAENG